MREPTSERILSPHKDATIVYENVHRYAYASQFVERMRVLDLGSGEGHGASLLAERAAFVIGLELDPAAVVHAENKYARSNLRFLAASGVQIPLVELFDVVVCFETLGHSDNRDGLVREAKRLLKPNGLLIISTSDDRIDSGQTQSSHPSYGRALDLEELQKLLESHFENTLFLGQRVYANSNIWSLKGTDEAIVELLMEKTDSEFHMADRNRRDPAYYIALASDAENRFASAGSVLVDCSDALLIQHRDLIGKLRSEIREISKERTEALEWKNNQVASLEVGIQSNQQALEWRQSQISNLQESEKWLQDQARSLGEELDQERKDARAYIETLERAIRDKNNYIAGVEDSLTKANKGVQQLAGYKASRAWVVFTKLREIHQFLFGS